MDVTPEAPAGRQIIEKYGNGRFQVAGTVHQGSVLVFPDRTLAWPVAGMDQLTVASVAEVVARAAEVDIALLGCGRALRPIPKPIREALRAAGIVADPMDTGAACRTYNVLALEERRVAALLIAVE